MNKMYERGEPCYNPRPTNSYATAWDLRELKAELERKIEKEANRYNRKDLYLYSYTIPRATNEVYLEPIFDKVVAEDIDEADKIIRAKYPEYKVFQRDTCSHWISNEEALKMMFNKR